MDCPRCGAHNPRDAEYCSLCLEKFGAPAEPVEPEASAGTGAATVTAFADVEIPVSPGTEIDAEIPGPAAAPAPADGASGEAQGPGGSPPREPPPGADPSPRAARSGSGPGGPVGRWVAIGVLAACLAGGIWLLVGAVTGGRIYKSQMGTLKFAYPRGWQRVEAGEVPRVAGLNLSMLLSSAEFTVKAGGTAADGPAQVMSLQSGPNTYSGSWDSVKSKFKSRFVSELEDAKSPVAESGAGASRVAYREFMVGEDPAFGMKAEVRGGGGKALVERVLLIHEETAYLFTFFTREPGGSTRAPSEVIKSIRFDLSRPSTERE